MKTITASLHELVHAMDGYAEGVLVRRFGVDRSLFEFLAPLAGGPMDVTRLAESLAVSKAAVSKRVPRLEREGWLASSGDPGHGRRVVLSLTSQGHELVEQAGRLLNQQFGALLAEALIDPESFHSQLRTLVDAVHAFAAAETLEGVRR